LFSLRCTRCTFFQKTLQACRFYRTKKSPSFHFYQNRLVWALRHFFRTNVPSVQLLTYNKKSAALTHVCQCERNTFVVWRGTRCKYCDKKRNQKECADIAVRQSIFAAFFLTVPFLSSFWNAFPFKLQMCQAYIALRQSFFSTLCKREWEWKHLPKTFCSGTRCTFFRQLLQASHNKRGTRFNCCNKKRN